MIKAILTNRSQRVKIDSDVRVFRSAACFLWIAADARRELAE